MQCWTSVMRQIKKFVFVVLYFVIGNQVSNAAIFMLHLAKLFLHSDQRFYIKSMADLSI